MTGHPDLLNFGDPFITRQRHAFGDFEMFSLCATINANSSECFSGLGTRFQANNVEAVKTIFHEQAHLFQIMSTPYGFFYYILNAYQDAQIAEILRYLVFSYGRQVSFPLLSFLKRHPPRQLDEIWRRVRAFRLSQYIQDFFEGDGNVIERDAVGLFSGDITAFFSENEVGLADYLTSTGRLLPYPPSLCSRRQKRRVHSLLA